jgi:hypothetical protein
LNDILEVAREQNARPPFGGLSVVKALGLRKEELTALKAKLDAEKIRNLTPELWRLLNDIVSE